MDPVHGMLAEGSDYALDALKEAQGKLKIPLVDIEELIDLLSAQSTASGLGLR